MIILFYMAVLVSLLVLRYRAATGHRMSEKRDGLGRVYYEGVNIVEAVKRPESPRGGRSVVDIGLKLDRPFFFRIRRLSALPVMLEHMKLAEYVDGIPGAGLAFVAEHPDDLRELINNRTAREAIYDIFVHYEAEKIVCFGQRIWVRLRGARLKNYNGTMRSALLSRLWEIAHVAQENEQARAGTGREFHGALRLPWVMAAHLALLACGIFAGFYLLIDDRVTFLNPVTLWVYGFLLAIPLSLLWVNILYKFLRRTMWTILALADFILLGLTGIVLLSVSGIYAANRYLPQPPAVHINSYVDNTVCSIRCHVTTGGHGIGWDAKLSGEECRAEHRNKLIVGMRQQSRCLERIDYDFTLLTAPVPDMDKSLKIRVTREDFDTITLGDPVSIAVYRGAFGLRWIDKDEWR